MKVGTLAAANYSRREIEEKVGATSAEVKAAFERLKRVGHTLG